MAEASTIGAHIEPGSPRAVSGDVGDKIAVSADVAEAGADENIDFEGEEKGIVLKIGGEDWIDVERKSEPAVPTAAAPPAPFADVVVEGETAGGEASEVAKEEEVEAKKDEETKTEETPSPLSRFVPHMRGLKKKMRARQVEGGETKKKRKSEVKFGADKAYDVQFDVSTAHHEFDDNRPEQVLDLCLIMDCTGSMSSWIEHCKETLHKVIDATVARDPNCKVRTAFVGYRDFSDKSDLFQLHDFTYDADAVKKFISNADAKGGGDFPEDVHGAIRKALDLSWSGLDDSVKLAVFVADAPCHGNKYHVGHKHDDFPDGNPAGLVLEDLMKEMSDQEILVSLYQLNNENETMYKIMKEAHAQGEEKEGVEFVDMRDIKPAPTRPKRSPMGLMGGRGSGSVRSYFARPSRRSPATLEEPREDSMRRAYSARTSHTIEQQCRKMRTPNRLNSRRSCKSGW